MSVTNIHAGVDAMKRLRRSITEAAVQEEEFINSRAKKEGEVPVISLRAAAVPASKGSWRPSPSSRPSLDRKGGQRYLPVEEDDRFGDSGLD